MDKLRARKKLSDIEVALWPYTKKSDRSSRYESIQRTARTQEQIQEKVLKPGQMDAIYGTTGSIEAYLEKQKNG